MIDDSQIRERAYELWELAGKPDGAEQDHWREAREQLQAQQQPAGADTLDAVSGGMQSGGPQNSSDH